MVEETEKKVLIIGSQGMLGRTLVHEASKYFVVATTDRKDLDITDRKKVKETLKSIHPRIIVIVAAYTDVDGSEEHPGLAIRVNAEGVRHIAETAAHLGAVLISISTDYVFDGEIRRKYREDDKPNPISAYGRSKLKGEAIAQRTCQECVVIRTSWLFGEGPKGFIQSVLDSIRQKKPIRAVSDKIGAPTYVVDLSKAICGIIRLILEKQFDFRENNVVHICNSGECSWFDMAQFVVDYFKAKDISLRQLSLSEYPFKAKRPRYSALDNSKYQQLTGMPLRHWQDALGEFLKCQSL